MQLLAVPEPYFENYWSMHLKIAMLSAKKQNCTWIEFTFQPPWWEKVKFYKYFSLFALPP